ncbi:NADPH:quinone oxidoreductase family protein [Jatrophihabitans telluris]|uniref:NADPH:quinone oxidoreductase family protein n=1 Tax=Jatrophihabitans telluris TaxID=2038343 RepID=A0ABY4R2S8_9ACTN|nr:NADPH:quinone oxidoreductase family protein [Jatrophihabitans telluris]UQX90213.1 NADPH:quinone oxidoreductase family protein [Jatrophihabitans telluris]
MRAVQLSSFGGPEVLQVVDVAEPSPAEGTAVFTVRAAGINYADTHATEDSYLAKQQLPLIPGGEVVVELPESGRGLALVGTGGYAERIALAPAQIIPVPSGVSDPAALACLVQGASAWHLLRTSTHLSPGETVVVHAAAGGVGSIAVQLAKHWGAGRVIATASSADKRRLALELGADVAVDSRAEDLTAALKQANGGKGVDVVLEMTGGSVFDQSLAALAPFGRLAVYGMAGRSEPSPVRPTTLMAHSTAVIGFWLAHTVRRPGMLAAAITDLFGLVAAGTIRPVIGGRYTLDTVADAHRELLARTSTGKLFLDPTAR